MDTMPTMKPTMYISSKQLPALKDWKVGESYDLIVSVKQIGLHENSDGSMSGDFEIETIMAADSNDPMDLEDVNAMDNNNDFMKNSARLKEKAFAK